MKRLFNIIQSLSTREKHFDKKILVLAKMINEPDHGHMLDPNLVRWARKLKLNVKAHFEDHTTWHTVTGKGKLKED